MNKGAWVSRAVAGVLVLVVVSVLGLFGLLRQVANAAEDRKQNRLVVRDANGLLTDLIDAEAGQRGFLLTGDTTYLYPYTKVREGLADRVVALGAQTHDRASAELLRLLQPLVDAKVRELTSQLAVRREQNGRVLSQGQDAREKSLTDSIRVTVLALTDRENASLVRREEEYATNLRNLFVGIALFSGVAAILSVALVYLMWQRRGQEERTLMHAETRRLLAAQEDTSAALRVANLLLADSEERLSVTLSSIGDAVLATDDEARVVRLNPVAERLMGWSSTEAVGRPVADVFRVVNKETRALSTIPVAKTLAQGAIQGLANHTVLISRDGTERDIADSCAPIRSRDGTVVGAVLVFRDVTAEYAVQRALNDKSALIETVLSTVADGILTFHAIDGAIANANAAAERIFGYERNELVGHHFATLVPAFGRLALNDAFERFRPGDAGMGHEVVGQRKNQEAVSIEIAISEMLLSGQRYFTAIVRDITAKKSAEAALRDASALQNAIFSSANFSSIATDAHGTIQVFNVGAERMLGYSASNVLDTLTPADISDPVEIVLRAKALSEEYGETILPGFEALVFRASRGIEDIYELTYIRKDGSRLPAVVSVTALRNTQDMIIGYLLVGTDNTARKLVEADRQKLDQRLRDQQFYTRSLIESNIDALMTTDPSGIITDVNRQMETLTGSSRDELIGAPFKSYFTEPERADAVIKRVLSEKAVSDYELTARAHDGRTTVVSCNASTFYDRARNLQGVFAAARDVTERKQTEVELKKATAAAESASRAKSEFLATMSHEIRTPMNAIMGIADLLAKTSLTAEQDRFVQVFRRAGDNLLNLVNDILDLSKVEAAQLELEQTGFQMRDLMGKVIEVVSASAQEKGLTLTYDVANDVPVTVLGDPTRLQQVLINLLGNAIKFTESGAVSLRVTSDTSSAVPTALRFEVADTGIGIAPDKLARVFERFTQADSSTTRRFGGSGLGLTICRRLVELMGGRVWVESAIGRGSTFSFSVPFELFLAEAEGTANPVSAELVAPLLPLRILLVEDSADNGTIIVAYLSDTPYTVDIAVNGAIGYDMFVAGRYDLVLMDRQMPVMDGLASTRAIRAWEQNSDRQSTPIIALTASALKGDREQCLAAGCTAFLTKPIRQDVLLRAIAARSAAARVPTREERIQSMEPVVPANLQIAERVPTFLANRWKDLRAMREALDDEDLATIRRLGHNMSGTGASYGFQAITDTGRAIEEEAERGDMPATRHWVDELGTYLARVSSEGAAE